MLVTVKTVAAVAVLINLFGRITSWFKHDSVETLAVKRNRLGLSAGCLGAVDLGVKMSAMTKLVSAPTISTSHLVSGAH